jgi:hypothetical protein
MDFKGEINMEIQWTRGPMTFDGRDGVVVNKRHFYSEISAMDFEALVIKAKELMLDGFVFAEGESVTIHRVDEIKDQKIVVTYYDIRETIYAKNNTTALAVNVYCGIASSIEKAIEDAIVTTGKLVYLGDPIEGGKGQLKRCKEIAMEIFRKHGNYLKKYDVVCVEYKTRGGKGGWASKIAERSFYSSELIAGQ